MSWFQVIVLAVVQGLTEFLPVSSSGHLALLEMVFNVSEGSLFFNVWLHLASVLAVIIVLRVELWQVVRKGRLFLLLVVGTIPGAVAGYWLSDRIDASNGSVIWLVAGFILTAATCFLIDRNFTGRKYEQLSGRGAFLIGVMQALALIPSLSRSAATIYGGKLLKLDRAEAVKFSFLLSVPIILGASAKELISADWSLVSQDMDKMLVAFIICLVVSVLVVAGLLKLLNKISFRYFGYYTVVLALIILFLNYWM
ncbi:MAG: undecaprenyl-diphosphate phosphatase [Patescibacteria group bacterium]